MASSDHLQAQRAMRTSTSTAVPRGKPLGELLLVERQSADASASDHLLIDVPVVSRHASAREAREAVMANPEAVVVYVVGEQRELVGVLAIATLFGMGDDERIAPHVEPAPPSVEASADQEHVALVAIKHGLPAVPVRDAAGQFLGIVPVSALLRVLHHEHIEDIDLLSGVLRQAHHVTPAMVGPSSRRVIERLPWLLVGLVGSALATGVVASFEASLKRSVAVAFFIPGIVYLADAIGTQTEAVAVRNLSHQVPQSVRAFLAEMRTGFLLGLALAAPVLPLVWWGFDDYRLACAVALAILVAGTVAAGVGFAFPLLLSRLRRDPALGSGPLATVVQDVLSLLAYFVAVRALME